MSVKIHPTGALMESLCALISGIYTLRWQRAWISEPLSVAGVSHPMFSWPFSASTFRTLPWRCSSARSRRRETRPQRTVSIAARLSNVNILSCPEWLNFLPDFLSVQEWRSRFWALCSAQPSRGRSWAWPMLPAYLDLVTSSKTRPTCPWLPDTMTPCSFSLSITR